jgi:taurine dioxygenase
MNITAFDELGAQISDVRCADISVQNVHTLQQNLYHHKLLILKDQVVSEQEYCDFAHKMGTPVPYLQDNYHHPEHPLIFVSSNIKKDGKSIGVARTGGYWHSDTSFLENPVPITMLYPQVIPKNSQRTTLFIDLEKAFRHLPHDLKQRLTNTHLIHSGRYKYKVRPQDAGLDIGEILAMIDNVQAPVSHPAILKHPHTQQEAIYATRGFTISVADTSSDDAEALLAELFEFIEQPQFTFQFQWQLGDIILWDNRFLAHKSGRLEPQNKGEPEEDTMMYRIMYQD